MKRKILIVALSAAAVALLCGCGQNSASNTTPDRAVPAMNQTIPGGTTSNEVVAPPVATPATTNSPGATNPPAASP